MKYPKCTVWMYKGGDILLRYELQFFDGWYDFAWGNGFDSQRESFFKEHCIYIGVF